MRATGRRNFLLCSIVTLTLMAVSCAGPEQPKVGTPLFHWNAAKQTFGAGDYNKANDNLGEVIRTDNEYTARALPWRLVLLAGMTKGNSELAEIWENGAGANRTNPTRFRTQANVYRKLGGQLALQFAETLQKSEAANKAQQVTLVMPFPAGSAAEIPQVKRVSSGILIPEAEADTLEQRVRERAVLLAACRAVGAPDDPAKAQQVFKSEPLQIDWPVFAAALANSLYDQADLFTNEHLDRPDRLEYFSKKALELLKAVPDSKEVKSLKANIDKLLKKKR